MYILRHSVHISEEQSNKILNSRGRYTCLVLSGFNYLYYLVLIESLKASESILEILEIEMSLC